MVYLAESDLCQRPNILMIMTDQQRYDSLGCYGFSAAHTPNLDQLASEGVLFERCYVNNTICTPSRASIFTGKTLPGHGVYRLHDDLPMGEELFTVGMQKAGYETALIGKLHVSSQAFEAGQRHPGDGFDHYEYCVDPYLDLHSPLNSYAAWLRENHPDFFAELEAKRRRLGHFPQDVHVARWTAERTINFLKSRNQEKPFFCLMSFYDPHDPYLDYPVEMAEMIDPDAIPPPNRVPGEMLTKPTGIAREHELSYAGSYQRISEEHLLKMRAGYHASIAFLDQEIGRTIRVLDAMGLKENTAIVFVSDHGDMLGDHELLVKGAFFYDPCTRVPLIIRYPQSRYAGTRIDKLVQPHDIAATVLSIAGITDELSTMPESIDLASIVADIHAGRDYAVCMYRGSGIRQGGQYFDPPTHCTMFRDERYKLNVYHDVCQNSINHGRLQGELFDMLSDPLETTNLWDDPNVVQEKVRLLGRLLDWMVYHDQSVLADMHK